MMRGRNGALDETIVLANELGLGVDPLRARKDFNVNDVAVHGAIAVNVRGNEDSEGEMRERGIGRQGRTQEGRAPSR